MMMMMYTMQASNIWHLQAGLVVACLSHRNTAVMAHGLKIDMLMLIFGLIVVYNSPSIAVKIVL